MRRGPTERCPAPRPAPPPSGNVDFDCKADRLPLTMGGNFSYMSGAQRPLARR